MPDTPGARGAAFHAILLAGGRGSRLGGADKAALSRGGRTLLDHWLDALTASGAEEIVVVGPDHLQKAASGRPSVRVVREEPAYGGPAAAVYAGMKTLSAEDGYVLLLAVDVVEPAPLLDWLLRQASDAGGAAVVPLDQDGRDQFLSSAVPVQALRRQVEGLSPQDVEGGRVRTLLAPLQQRQPLMPAALGQDVDRPEDAARLGVSL